MPVQKIKFENGAIIVFEGCPLWGNSPASEDSPSADFESQLKRQLDSELRQAYLESAHPIGTEQLTELGKETRQAIQEKYPVGTPERERLAEGIWR